MAGHFGFEVVSLCVGVVNMLTSSCKFQRGLYAKNKWFTLSHGFEIIIAYSELLPN